MSQTAAEESGHACFTGELGHVGVEVEPVNTFEFQDDVIVLELGDGERPSHGGVGWAFVPSVYGKTRRLSAHIPASRRPA